jgi:alanine dehydrogenase
MSNETHPLPEGTLLLARADVLALLAPPLCIAAVEDAFARAARGEVPPAGILGMHAPDGGFHVKAGLLARGPLYFAAKVNANFPHNAARFGLPTIQGAVLLFDAGNGRLLAIMDSMALTALRTAAATAVAAKHLAKASIATVLLVGCGAQALEQLRALLCVRQPGRIQVFDLDTAKAAAFAAGASTALGTDVTAVQDLRNALPACDVVITCTTAKQPFVTPDLIRPGTFIAAVGADHEDKNEIAPELMAAARVVTDVTSQAARIGDLHHAIAAGRMRADEVHAELGQLAAGLKQGRLDDSEVALFDSTGTGLQDVAAAIAVYHAAVEQGRGIPFRFS